MSEISNRIDEYIINSLIKQVAQTVKPIQPTVPTKPGAPSTPLAQQPATPKPTPAQVPRTPGMLPQFGLVSQARAERQGKSNLVPVKRRELVHDKKTGNTYYRDRTIYVRPEDLQEKDPRTKVQAYVLVVNVLEKILNTGMKQMSLDDLDSLIARVRGKKHGNWPQIIEKLMQLRVMLKRKDWRTSEWLIQSTIAISRNTINQILRQGSLASSQPQQQIKNV